MTTTFTSATLNGSYNDDYDKDKHFHQILFNSGRALQARELTQLQTLLYQEIGRIGRNVFKEGAAVSSGGMGINSSYEFVKIASTNQGGAFSNIQVGTVFRESTTDLKAKVLEVRPQDNGDITINTLYVQYIDDNASTIGSTPSRFGDGSTLFDESGSGYELITDGANAAGRACRFDVETGDFFVLGRFVNASKQSLILNAYDQEFTGAVGFKVVQEVVTVSDDNSLYDNTGGVLNTASPGADRYRITLTLTKQADIASTDTFVFLANIENSKIVEEVDEADAYNKINELLALRTNEESGDYVIEPFSIHYEDASSSDDFLELIISAGSAYVNGYRVNNPSPVKLNVPRPTATENFNNDIVPVEYGNYFYVTDGAGAPNLDGTRINISTSSTDPSGSTIGTCRIRAVIPTTAVDTGIVSGATHKVYVYDVRMNDGQNISGAKSIGSSTSDFYKLSQDTNSKTKLYDISNNDLLMPTTRPRLESLGSEIIIRNQRRTTASTGVGETTVDISSAITGLTDASFVDTANWVIADASNHVVTGASGATNGTISGLTQSTSYEILYFVQYTASVRTKTKTTGQTATLDLIDSAGFRYYKFPDVDIFDIAAATADSANGKSVLHSITLDDGQRDNYYQRGRAIWQRQDSAPNSLYVDYTKLTRGGTGDFYSASSYASMNYSEIPTHVDARGQELSLFNYLDFRPDKVDGDLTDDGTFSNIHYLPKNGEVITADIAYYLPRSDKLLLTQEGELQLLMGQQSQNPQFKPTPENAIELYKIQMNPNTLNEEDLSFTAIDHPHYTMKDIAELEAKIDRIEEYTKLSILELRNRLDRSLDSDGLERTEIGTVSDDASDQTRSDTNNDDHASSIDPEGQVILPQGNENNTKLQFDAANSSGVVKKGDNVYLTYSEEQWAYQELASTTVTINPTGNVQNIGTIKLSPSSDDWKESYERATRVVEGQNKLDTKQAQLWNNWQWNWQGRTSDEKEPVEGSTGGYSGIQCGGSSSASFGRTFTTTEKYRADGSTFQRITGSPKHVSRVVASDTLRKRYGNRYVDAALLPWIRSRKVYFHAKGLKPNTKFTPFFDGTDVSNWVREETSFVRFADRTDDIGNRYGYSTLTEHPDGKSDLIADANGEIIGSFFIPSPRLLPRYGQYRKQTKALNSIGLRFRAGVREFMLLDINTPDFEQAGSKAFAYYSVLGFALNLLRHRYLRYPDSPYPASYLNKRSPVFSSKEIKDRLDKISSSSINLIDAKLSGQYGGETVPLSNAELTTIDTNNTMSTVVSDYITVNQNQQSGGVVGPITPPENPLAQTFYVDNPFGLVITKVDLFFAEKDDGDLPVSIHIRPVEDGKPSTTSIVPDSHVYVNPANVNAVGGTPTLSLVQENATSFTFDEPVVLQPWQRYAVCVTSASTKYKLYVAQTQQPVLGSTSRIVTTQPIPGSLFLPQNGTTWMESKDQDFMYRLTRAKFSDGNGSMLLKNADLPDHELGDFKLFTVAGIDYLTVTMRSHGLEKGDKVTIAGAEAFNGVAAASINKEHTVNYANGTGFVVRTGDPATSGGFGGGEQVRIGKNVVFTTANLQLEHSIPRSTSLDVSAKFTSGNMVSGNDTRYNVDAQYQRITPFQNIEFDKPRGLFNLTAETDNLGSGERSVVIKVDFKSSNDYVSPVVDLQRSDLITAGFEIDNPVIRPVPTYLDSVAPLIPVAETEPSGQTGLCRHITTPVKLPEPAVGIDARVMVNLPDSAEVEFYYRTGQADEDLWVKPWVKQEPVRQMAPRNDGTFEMQEFLPGGRGGNLEPFYQAQGKFVMKGSRKNPALKDISLKFLAD